MFKNEYYNTIITFLMKINLSWIILVLIGNYHAILKNQI